MRWESARLAHIATLRVSNVDKKSVDGEQTVRLCNYVDVYKNDVIHDELDFMRATATATQVSTFRLRQGDTVLTKDSETADDIGVPAYVAADLDDLVCGYHLAVASPDRRRVDPRFLYWLLRSAAVRGQWSVLATGVTRMGLRSDDIGRVRVPLPPLDEQRRIADFLDAETLHVGQVTDGCTALTVNLAERRRALVSAGVWGAQGDRARGPSGLDTVATAPQHWRRVRNKQLFRESKAVGTATEARLLSVSHLTGVSPRSELDVTMFMADDLAGYKSVRPGDLVINTLWAWMGALGVSSHDGFVSPAYGVYRAIDDEVLPSYFDALYRTDAYVCEMTRRSQGVWTSRLRLYPETFLAMPVVVPPKGEQQAIMHSLRKHLVAEETLHNRVTRMTALLAERQRALITAAVTGELDVTTAGRSFVLSG